MLYTGFFEVYLMKIALNILFFLLISAASMAQVLVVDGDSLEIKNQRIRLYGLDAPEYDQSCVLNNKTKYNCGLEAKTHLESLVIRGRLKCVEESIDRYGRSVCECFVTERDTGIVYNLNEEMLKKGWAISYYTKKKSYMEAEKSAKKRKVGVWQGRFMRPELYRILHQ